MGRIGKGGEKKKRREGKVRNMKKKGERAKRYRGRFWEEKEERAKEKERGRDREL